MEPAPAAAKQAYVPLIKSKRKKQQVVFQHQRIGSIIATRPGSFDTDITRTRNLWTLVRSLPANIPTASSRDRAQHSQLTTSTDPAHNLPGGRNYASRTLEPHRITIDLSTYVPRPAFAYFTTDAPPACTTRLAHYTHIPELRHTTLWLEPADCPAIAASYQLLHRQGNGQGECVLEALRSLLKWEGRPLPAVDAAAATPSHLPIRLFEDPFDPAHPAATDQPALWRAPPTTTNPPSRTNPTATSTATAAALPGLAATPTVSYWLWAGAFGALARATDALASRTHLRYDHALCPYLSVVVRGGGDAAAARQAGREELAGAAAMALHNNGSGMRRHFCVLLAGPRWECWCVEAGRGTRWAGCSMRRVAGGALDCPVGLAGLMDWLNEIHRWGNTVFAAACVAAARVFDGGEEVAVEQEAVECLEG